MDLRIWESLSQKIEFKNVDYSYDNKDIVLKKCKLNFVKGKITGITGEFGSGKSTIVDLIMGFDFPNKGKIKIDNVNIENLDLNDYRKKLDIFLKTLFYLIQQ